MRWPISAGVVLLLTVSAFLHCSAAQEKNEPLTDSVLLSLVAGNVLPESILHEIDSRGLAFRPSEAYEKMLREAGADSKVLGGLKKARVSSSSADVGNDSSAELLKHLTTAGRLLRNKAYEDVARELTDALRSGDGLEAAFVMGEVLRSEGKYPLAAAVYEEILRQNPDFPQAHTKLSFELYRLGDPAGALREAKAELARYPDNAEAHKNAGLALDLAQKYDPSQAEYNEALRIKPDYQAAHYDLGLMLENRGDLEGAIREDQKAIALDPNDIFPRYNLATVLARKGDYDGQIRELREVKRLDPNWVQVRMTLANTLFLRQMYYEAAQEYREVLTLTPDFAAAHDGLGEALMTSGNLLGAEQEYRTALKLDPSDEKALLNLGTSLENQEKYDEALAEFRRDAELYENSADAHRCIGRILVKKKDFTAAIPELKIAEALDPAHAQTHELYAKALQNTGQAGPSIDEFRQAVSLEPTRLDYQVELAAALEKNGDWILAMEQYRKASLVAGSRDHFSPLAMNRDRDDAEREYKAGQMRFQSHLAAMRKAGKTEEAAKLESAVRTSRRNMSLSEKLDAALQAGFEAMRNGQSNEIIQNYREAVDLAEKLRPHDRRLMIALRTLGLAKMELQQYDEARTLFGRELRAVEEISGPQSIDMADPLQNLAKMEVKKKDYAAAREYATRAQNLIAKNFGEENEPYATTLRVLAQTYAAEGDYGNAEPQLVRAASIEEKLGAVGGDALITLYQLCVLYDRVNKPENAAACNARIVVMLEKLYGPDDPVLISTLKSEASELRSIGHSEEATKIDQRIDALKVSAKNQK